MGKKKGKQSGSFGTKSKFAAYTLEIAQCVSEHNHSSRQRSRRRGKPSLDQQNVEAGKSVHGHGRERGALKLTHLRGLIRERIIEDRERDRLSRMTSSVASRARTTTSRRQDRSSTNQHEAGEKGFSKIGWLMTYDLSEIMAGIQQDPSSSSTIEHILSSNDNNGGCKARKCNAVASLQSLAICALAPILNEYVSCLGKEYVHQRLGLLPGCHISALSVLAHDLNDDSAFVLGAHSHIDRLVLNGSRLRYDIEEDDEDQECNSNIDACYGGLTTKGLSSIVLGAEENRYELKNQAEDFLKEEECKDNGNFIVESWEDLLDSEIDDNDSLCRFRSSSRVRSLKRLELRNFNPDNTQDVIDFLFKFPQMTHLSLSGSLNAMTGPQFLLWNANIATKKDQKHASFVDFLANLEILDLSGCQWIHFDLLTVFVKRLLRNKSSRHSGTSSTSAMAGKNISGISLKLICVGGYDDGYLTSQCKILNDMTLGRPLISTSMSSTCTVPS